MIFFIINFNNVKNAEKQDVYLSNFLCCTMKQNTENVLVKKNLEEALKKISLKDKQFIDTYHENNFFKIYRIINEIKAHNLLSQFKSLFTLNEKNQKEFNSLYLQKSFKKEFNDSPINLFEKESIFKKILITSSLNDRHEYPTINTNLLNFLLIMKKIENDFPEFKKKEEVNDKIFAIRLFKHKKFLNFLINPLNAFMFGYQDRLIKNDTRLEQSFPFYKISKTMIYNCQICKKIKK